MTGARVDRDELANLHRLGFSAPQIAVRLGCSTMTVVRWRKRAGVAAPIPPNAGHPVTAERLEAARQLFADGLSRRDVCRTLGMSEKTLRKHLPESRWTPAECAEYRAMVRQLNRIGASA